MADEMDPYTRKAKGAFYLQDQAGVGRYDEPDVPSMSLDPHADLRANIKGLLKDGVVGTGIGAFGLAMDSPITGAALAAPFLGSAAYQGWDATNQLMQMFGRHPAQKQQKTMEEIMQQAGVLKPKGE